MAKTPVRQKSRRLKKPQYKSLKLQKRIKHPVRLPSVYQLTKTSIQMLWEHKLLFFGITIIFGLLNLVLVQGIAGSTDPSALKQAVDKVATGHWASVSSGLSVFAFMVGSAGNTSSSTAGGYQVFLGLIGSLAMIWALRQVAAGTKYLRIRDAYYRGMYPLVPFVLILLVVSFQLFPLLIGSALYSLVVNNGVAVYLAEKAVWALLYLLLALLSFYMLSSSLFALYIVTLPDMTPVKALRSARELVRFRRWTVLRKLLCLPIILLVVAAIIMLPIIIWATVLAKWVFFFLTMSSLLAVHTYIYTLYRELLRE